MDIKKQTMRKIYAIHLFGRVFNATTLKLAGVFALLWEIKIQVSVMSVINNWPAFEGGVSANYRFFESAFLNAEIITQVLVLGIGTLFVLLARDLVMKRSANQLVGV